MADDYTPIFDEKTARQLVVAANEGNELADTEFGRDIRTQPYFVLEQKYGKDVADNRRLYSEQRVAVDQIENQSRDALQISGDTAVGVGAGFVGVVGSLEAAAVGAAGYVAQKIDPENTGISKFATKLASTTEGLTAGMRSLQSKELHDRQGLSGVEAQLDAEDNLARYEEDATDGASFIDSLAYYGRGTLNNAGRILSDTAVASDVIAQGIGSLGPSAKIASVASKLVTGTKTYNAAKIANAIAPTQGTRFLARGADIVNRGAIAAGVGVTEASGVYSQTVNDVLGRTHGELLDSSEAYRAMIEAGVDQDDAKATLASNTGMEAFVRQFPTAAAIGVIAGKFEAAPIASFRGSGFIGGLRQIGAETLEEGGQGASGQFNQNLAIRNQVDPSQSLSEGVDEQFATGAIAGAGMAGVLATPAAIGNTPRNVAKAVSDISGSGAGQRIAAAALSGADALTRGIETVSQTNAGQATISGAKAAVSKVSETVTPVVDRANEKISDYNSRPDREVQSRDIETMDSIQQLSEAELRTPIPEDLDAEKWADAKVSREVVETLVRTKSEKPVPESFKDTVPEGGTVVQNVSGMMKTFAQKGFRIKNMSDSDVMFAAQEFQTLRNSSSELPVAIRNKVKQVLASPDFKAIQQRATRIDLNKTQEDTGQITDDMVSETKGVALTNPANVNPEVTGKILEQKDRTDLTTEDVRLMGVAQRISKAINNHVGSKIEFKKDENVELSENREYKDGKKKLPKIPTIEAISRNISVGSLKDGTGKKLRSINDFARDIFQGAQSADKKIIDSAGIAVPVKAVAEQFGMFTQHMINKVGALNVSYDNRDANGNGTTEFYESLSQGKKMVPAKDAEGRINAAAGTPMTYRTSSPGSVAFARQVHADAVVAAEVYNALVEAFPDQFPDGQISVPELRGFETQTDLSVTSDPQESENPTVVDEGLSADKAEETIPEAPVVEVIPEADEQTLNDPYGPINGIEINEITDPAVLKAVNQIVNDVLKQAGIDTTIEVVELDVDHNKKSGKAFWGTGRIGLSPRVLQSLDNRHSQHIVTHEVMHMIDDLANQGEGTMSMKNFEYDPLEGSLYLEMYNAMKHPTQGETWTKFFSYVMTFSPNEQKTIASEIFSEVATVYMMNPQIAEEFFPLGVEYVKKVIASAQDGSGSRSVEVSVSEGQEAEQAPTDQAVSETKLQRLNSIEGIEETFSETTVEQKSALITALKGATGLGTIIDTLITDVFVSDSEIQGQDAIAFPLENAITINNWMLENLNKPDNLIALAHELIHMMDARVETQDYESATNSRFDEGGDIFAEIEAERVNIDKWINQEYETIEYFEYAFGFEGSERASELSAQLGAILLTHPDMVEFFPAGKEFLDGLIARHTPVEKVSVSERTFENVNEKFAESFLKQDENVSYADGQGLLAMAREQDGNDNYVEFMNLYLQDLMDTANERLKTLKTNKDDEFTIFERIVQGEDTTQYRRNKNTIMVDKRTGEYDPDLLSIAAVAVLDWLTAARSTNVRDVDQVLEDMGLTYDMVSDEQLRDILYGIQPRDVAESLAKDIVRMWGMKINKDIPMVDARGAAEGMAKELLEALLEVSSKSEARGEMTLLNKKIVPYMDTESETGPFDQIVFDIYPMVEMQKAIGISSQGAVKKMLAPEFDTMPSIGAPGSRVDDTQARGDVKLSRREKKTLKVMQNQGHGLAETFSNVIEAISFEHLSVFLGKKDFSALAERHPLRASIAGKNLSVERDYLEAMQVVNAIKDAGFTLNGGLPEVFYRVGISRVGRHQFKGINPQNNKILRAMVTPTKATLDMTTKRHKDAFWLTVAQASGLNKVENEDHVSILQNIQREFRQKYGEAIEMIGEQLDGAEIDGAAFIEAMGGEGEMQQLAAVFAVASLDQATVDGTLESFETTLSFELDGKTDGPGNMMANFGQGLLTDQDFTNFKRVGFFLGTTAMNLNKFFTGGERDLYEVTSNQATRNLYDMIATANPTSKEQLHAVSRLSSSFGDMKIVDGQYSMTRNTAKNPMTKTVYGSSERGIGVGIAQDMITEMYRQLIANPDGIQDYPGGNVQFVKDFESAFGTNFPKNKDWNKSWLGTDVTENFTKIVTRTLGKVLSDTAKNVIGDKITKVSDSLVLMTAFQTEFLTAKFDELLAAKIAERVAEGKIKTNEKTGAPDRSSLTQRDYDAVVEAIRVYSPVYANEMQTLDIGSFRATPSGIKLSESMSGTFQSPSTMITPELAGVKAIPYITQGRGDAMMMNWIYGGENPPSNTLQVFDGIDMPIDKITEYAQQINEAVLQNWDADVIGDIVNDVSTFLEKTKEDPELLMQAWDRALSNAKKKKTTATAETPETLISDIIEMHRQSQARKAVFKRIGVSVDHMGGSATAYTRGTSDREWTLGEINNMISQELGQPNIESVQINPDGSVEGTFTENVVETEALQIEDKREAKEGEFSRIVVTDTETVIDGLLRETRNKAVQATVQLLKKDLGANTRIVIGSAQEVTDWYTENVGEMPTGSVIDTKGIYDPQNNVMLITDNNHETMTHELIHAATFQKVLSIYELGEANDTVGRLETLMSEFMEMDFSTNSKEVQDAANSAKAQILSNQTQEDAFSKAAALNEFMAWTLSNDALMKELKERPTNILTRLTKTVKALMQRLLGGVPSDMFSNILFNTELLITDTGAGNGNNNDGGGVGNGGDGNDGGQLTPNAHNFTNFWIDLAKQRLEEANAAVGTRGQKLTQISEYRDNAKAALKRLDFGGFSMSAYQKETFKAIHTVLAMEMRLDTQSAIALNTLFEFVTDNLTPEMFGPNNAQDRYSAVMELFGETKNDEDVSDAIAVLLALSQTSAGFRRAVDQLPAAVPNSGLNTDSVNDFLSSITAKLMNKAIGSIDTADGSVSEVLDRLADSILHEESEKEFRILAGLMQNVTKADEFLSGGFKTLAGITEAKNTEIQASNRSKMAKVIAGSVTAASAFMDSDRASVQAEALKRVTHMGTNLEFAIPIREFISEVIGTDSTNEKVVALLDQTTFAASAVRQNYREELPVILQDAFEIHPDETQWKASHNVLGKADFSVLYDAARPDASFRLISDEGHLDKKILEQEAVIRANFNTNISNIVLEKAQQLADFMNGKGAGHQLWRNAIAINQLAGDPKQSMIAEIDRLASLYAIKSSDPQQRITVSQMYRDQPEAVKNLVTYMQALNKEEDSKFISEEAMMNGYKGFIPDHGQPGSKVIIADDDQRVELEKKGFVRVADAPADENISAFSHGYYTTTTKQTGTYSQGAMQIIQDTYRGVDATSGLTVNGTTSGVIAGPSIVTITDEMNTRGTVNDPKEVLLPVYDLDGVIYYERAINPDVFNKFQAPKSNLALMLGAWAGRQVEEKFAQKYNQELVDELKKVHDSRGSNDDGLFVDLVEESDKWDEYQMASDSQKKLLRKPDRVHVESWNVISPQTKRYIKEVFGDHFYVRKDQMNLALGYRDPSVIDMWTGNTRVPKALQEGVQAITASIMGKDAMKRMAGAEGGIQGVVSTAKDLIVVRSLIVPYMNTQANVFQLATRGVGFKQMLKSFPEKLAEIEQFNKNSKKLIGIETRIQLAGTNKNKVRILEQQRQVIEDQNARFSIAPLIAAGAYKNISEGITELDVDLSSGKVGVWIENQVNKLPNSVQTIAKYGILSKDTAIYKGANKAVQYGDFIAKAIYYDQLLKEKGLDHDEAMKLVNEEFVNFSVLPGRTRTFLEGIGATWFLSFKIRIMKIAMRQLRENPVRSMILAATVADFGSPQADNLASVVADDRIGYSLGYDMLLNAPGLNPWMNVTEW